MFDQLTFSFGKSNIKDKCRFPGCGRKRNTKRLCKIHFKQYRNGQSLTPIVKKPPLTQLFPKEYNSWRCMKNRCYNPDDPSYKYCGARAITVCKRWLLSFANFLEDMGKAPSPIHTLDRKNNDLGYFPGNVRWATPSEQQHNTAKCRWVVYEGKSMLIGDLAEKVKISENSLRRRILKDNLTPEEAVKLIMRTKQQQKKRPRKNKRRRFP